MKFKKWLTEEVEKPGLWHTTFLKCRFSPEEEPVFKKWFHDWYGRYGFDIKFNPSYAGFFRIVIKIPPEEESDDAVVKMSDKLKMKWPDNIQNW